ncbi:MAG: hypothetical protein H6765_06070 [Candidatus Peribacteria bacterium]|nr:MAG: hypothetical protein H6765_06070 [Candidatus Peribacteria bacterium]
MVDLAKTVAEIDPKAPTSQEERSELLRKAIMAGASAPGPDGAVPIQDVLKIIGGNEQLWALLQEVFYDVNFASDVRMRYWELRNYGRAIKEADRTRRAANFESNYLGVDFTDPDAMLTIAFVETLKRGINKKK